MTGTLEVIDSYLSLDSTQYAQAPIGATRIATKGDGVDCYGTIPTWTSSNWEIEFDVVFPTTLVASTNTVIDSPTVSNRFNLNLTATTGVIAFTAGAVLTLDGVALTSGATAHPVDGAVHKIKITNTVLSEIGVVYRSYSLSNTSSANIFNLRLTDLDNSANSRFYPMDETIATSTFVDTSANAAHGTWVNRTSTDVVTVYPGAIKPGQEFWIAVKYEITDNSSNSGFNNSFSVSNSTGQTRVNAYNPESNNTFGIAFYNSNVKVEEHFPTPSPPRPAQADGVHTLVYHIKANGSSKTYWSGGTLSENAVGVVRDAALTYVNINGRQASIGTSNTRPAQDFYYFYLYNSLSTDDINALLAGENPMYVGDVLQGYNLSGDGDEVNGGTSLTLYNSPTFYVPPSHNRPLISNLIGSLIGNLIT